MRKLKLFALFAAILFATSMWAIEPSGSVDGLTGHTDNYGDPEQNLRYFGMKRAESLKAYMVNQGVDASQIRCESKGQNEPIAPNDSRANRAKNRRAVISFE